ncbi:MAG: NAD(P)H-dependent oxidoreductase subunit E [Thermotogota bacterium]
MKIEICVGTTCHLMGSSSIIEALEDIEEKIKDKIEIKYTTCFELCHGQMKPPIIKIDNKFYEDINPEKIKMIVRNKIGND